MRVFITGATGFVGRALLLRLCRDGHQPVAWVRSLQRGRNLLGKACQLVEAPADPAARALALKGALSGCEAVIHLAGENVLKGRWSARRKAQLIQSRIQTTDELVEAIKQQPTPPKVMVAASAVGYYGDHAQAEVTEATPAGSGFLADLCVRWEAAARAVEGTGVRLVQPRIGVVLGHEGGMLATLLPLFMAGLGGPVGSGRQVLPWIHLHDLVDMVCTSLTAESWRGPFNAVSPQPVDNHAFTQAMATALGKPAKLPVPAWALRLLLGEAAEVALSSCRAMPQQALAWGFAHRYPSLDQALSGLLDPKVVQIGCMTPQGPQPVGEAYTERRPPRYLLEAHTDLKQDRAQVFEFFCRAENLGLMTPADMAMQIVGAPPDQVEVGTNIRYTLRLGPLPLRWRTRIAKWQVPALFVDAQEQGPYAAWWHEHRFTDLEAGTHMEDRVFYAIPASLIGRLVHALFIKQQLQRIFWYRASAISLRFG
jgi:uncharacterized protein (TIGR01777 family)